MILVIGKITWTVEFFPNSLLPYFSLMDRKIIFDEVKQNETKDQRINLHHLLDQQFSKKKARGQSGARMPPTSPQTAYALRNQNSSEEACFRNERIRNSWADSEP